MRARSLVTTLAVAMGCPACQQPPDGAEAGPATLDALRQLRDEHVAAVLEENVDEELATYTEAAVFIPPDHPGVVGAERIRSWLEESFDSFDIEQLEIELADFTVREELAVAHFRYSWSVAPEGGGSRSRIPEKASGSSSVNRTEAG